MGVYEELLDLVPAKLHREFGEVFYSGRTAFQQPSPIYLLGFNPGGDPARSELSRYTVGADLAEARTPQRHDWSGFEDNWHDFGAGAVRFQRRVLHLIHGCGFGPRQVPASNAIFVRSARIDALDTARKVALLRNCWPVHEAVIRSLGVRVVVCFGHKTGDWIKAQLAANAEPAIEVYKEDNGRRWRSETRVGRDGIEVVTLTHPSRANWENPRSDPTQLVVNALERAAGSRSFPCGHGSP